jgi:ubiquinone/menaquinone biosynthesis C-methylase UbiE
MDYKDYAAGQTNDHFWFKAKKDLINMLMQKVSGERRQLKILSIGVGTGDVLDVLSHYGENYITDVDEKSLSVINPALYKEMKVSSACALPYADGFFDVVISCDVFEHIEDHVTAASEVRRVLKNNGALVFTVPAFQFLFSSHDVALEHFRRYNKKSISALLSQFESNIFFWNSLLFPLIAVGRIINRNAPPKVDQGNLPSLLNKLFFYILAFDNFLIKRNLSMPIGLSLVGYCFKRDK